jgi:hypothetical protein
VNLRTATCPNFYGQNRIPPKEINGKTRILKCPYAAGNQIILVMKSDMNANSAVHILWLLRLTLEEIT